ncbi:MAG: MFS transporter [Pirellulaceae bacterium]
MRLKLPEETDPTDAKSPETLPRDASVATPQRRSLERAWAPMSIPAYRSFWIAGLFSNLGTWMHETGAQWLMTSLEPNPAMVAAVRTAMTIPVFCLALPAGVWADRFDRRTWLIASQLLMLAIAGLMAVLAMLGWITPVWLLVLTAAMGVAMILNQPAWQALTPELVPPALIPSAVQAGSVSFNLARSLGPLAAGLLIASLGVGVTFLFNALSFMGVIAVLLVWKPDLECQERRASPDFVAELRKGMFVISNSTNIRNVLIRVFAFAAAASILWSLLPLVATQKLHFLERGFGLCLGLIGSGAVFGAWFLPSLRLRYSSELIMLVAQLLFASICVCIGLSESSLLIMPGLFLVGASWMTTMTTLNATAQVYLPRKFRARGMSAFMMSFALGMALGSFTWGWLANMQSLSVAFLTAASLMVLGTLALYPLKIGAMHTEV